MNQYSASGYFDIPNNSVTAIIGHTHTHVKTCSIISSKKKMHENYVLLYYSHYRLSTYVKVNGFFHSYNYFERSLIKTFMYADKEITKKKGTLIYF